MVAILLSSWIKYYMLINVQFIDWKQQQQQQKGKKDSYHNQLYTKPFLNENKSI